MLPILSCYPSKYAPTVATSPSKLWTVVSEATAVAAAELLAALKLPQPRVPFDSHMQAMLAALPDQAAAKPSRPRKVLVFNRCVGFVHTPIPLVAKMIDTFGNRTKSWSTTVTFPPADVSAQNLAQYDALVLNSTTGAFLDDPDAWPEYSKMIAAIFKYHFNNQPIS